MRGPRLAEVEIFVDSMPVGRVEFAGGKGVDGGALGDGDVCHDQAMVVLGHVVVDGFGEDPEVSVEEYDEKDGKDSGRGQLNDGADLETGLSQWPCCMIVEEEGGDEPLVGSTWL